uniref:Uncharacterized protein n=1 Tax=Anopheles quadriannulatus TaxID=34691 RepID=A0A182XF05_ANOQN
MQQIVVNVVGSIG